MNIMLEELLKKQKKEKSELLFKHARQLMDMITDEELVEIYS
jgi:polyhydroxyalkanoate synthesis regulator phasin